MTATVLEAWSHVAGQHGYSRVVPDGCRDLIRISTPGIRPFFIISELASGCEWVTHAAGTVYHGFRLRPGAIIDEQSLLALGRVTPEADPSRILDWLNSHSRMEVMVEDALAHLAQDRMPADASAQRRLERVLKKATGRPPMFWRGLARVRRAARLLTGDNDLAALAADAGYADQAHLTREMRRWFGVTPKALRDDGALLALVCQSGYGEPPTGEHISTKTPSRSAT
ncbi:MAG: helix-turn-helix domain-containing protein [Magnetospirillum gryphiswaldense]|nr:helix-turn-helix domain-containing protein [Magnetospirillum gryphiswaldense]